MSIESRATVTWQHNDVIIPSVDLSTVQTVRVIDISHNQGDFITNIFEAFMYSHKTSAVTDYFAHASLTSRITH